MIVTATISDAKVLTKIALISKSYWGYSKEVLLSWTSELTVSEKMISEMIVYKYVVDKKTIGFYILNKPNNFSIELEFLFVLPDFIGKGIGNQLLEHAFKKATKLHCKEMVLLADPNAVSFYKSKGFYEIDKKESTIVGRFLPVMQKDLRV